MKFLVPIDHNRLESFNFRFQLLASDPGSPSEGMAFYDSVLHTLKVRNDTGWVITDPAKVANGYIPLAKVSGAAPVASPTFTGQVTTPAGSAGQAGGLKLTSGPLKTTPVAGDSGSIEYNGTSLSFIDSTGARRILGESGSGVQTVTLTAPAAGFTITQSGTGTAPIFTFALNDDLAALEALSSTGVVRRTGANTWSTGNVNLTSEVTGVLPVANGGTGVGTSTGTGDNVLNTSPALAGTPTAPTAGADTNTTQLATTAFVVGQASSTNPAALGAVATGTSAKYARGDHVHAMPTLSQVGNATADRSMSDFKITSLADPIADTDAANKRYVDNAIAGLSWKDEARFATTGNVNLTGGAPNSVDGGTPLVDDRILVRANTDATQNGLYIVQTVGTGSNGTWARAPDANTAAELRGMAVFISEGTANKGIRYVNTNVDTLTLGSTNVTFAVFDATIAYTNGNGLDLTGQTFSVKTAANSGIVVDGTGVSVDTAIVVRKFPATIGDNSATSIPVTHNLGTKDVTVSLREVSTDAVVGTDWVATSVNVVTFTFASPPANASLRAVIHG